MASPDRTAESTEAAILKLKQLTVFIERPLDRRVIEFGKYIASKTYPEETPMGFAINTTMLIEDLRSGVDGFTRAPIINPLVGQPQYIYDLLSLNIPTLAKIAF